MATAATLDSDPLTRDDPLMTPREVAEFLRVAVSSVYRYCDDGTFPAAAVVRFGLPTGSRQSVRVRRSAVVALLPAAAREGGGG